MPSVHSYFKSRKTSFAALGTILILTIVAYEIYERIQPTVDYPNAPLFDGNQYLKITAFLQGSDSVYEVSFPYNTRVLVPALVLLMPFDDVIMSFKALNLLFSLASLVALFFLWRDFGLSPLLMFSGFFWLLFHWTGLIRLNLFDPVNVDLPLYFFQALLCLIVIHGRFYWLLILAPLAVAQKESFIAIMIILAGFSFYHRKEYEKMDLIWIGLTLFISILVKFGMNQVFPQLEAGRSGFTTVAYHLKLVALDPFRIARWIAAIFVAFGGVLILNLRRTKKFSLDRQHSLLGLFSLTYLVFGILAGGDMLRIVFLGFPFIMTLLLSGIRKESENLVIIAVVLSLPLMKLRSTIPDPVNSWTEFVEWYPEYASWQMVLIWLGYAVVMYLVTLAWRKYEPRKVRTGV